MKTKSYIHIQLEKRSENVLRSQVSKRLFILPGAAEPVIAQLVERRTVVGSVSVILRSAVRLRLAG